MTFTQGEIAAIVGQKEIELIWLRARVAQLESELKKKETDGIARPDQPADAA